MLLGLHFPFVTRAVYDPVSPRGPNRSRGLGLSEKSRNCVNQGVREIKRCR